MNVDENTLCFGPERNLIGILSEPAQPSVQARVGCLLINVGINHRIGPRRINVKAARELAQAGIPSLRIDLSGVGDSRASAQPHGFRQQSLLDMQAGLDQLQASTGLTRFIVLGICSGAANGLTLAVNDPRVVGLLMVDGHIFLTRQVRMVRKLRILAAFPFNPSVRRGFGAWSDWMGWLRAPGDRQARERLRTRLFGRVGPTTTEETGLLTEASAERTGEEFTRDMKQLVTRGVDVYLVYTASLLSADGGGALLRGLGPQDFLSRVRYDHFADLDHTATLLSAQRRLLDAAGAWAARVNAAQPAPEAAPGPLADTPRPAAPALAPLEQRLASHGA